MKNFPHNFLQDTISPDSSLNEVSIIRSWTLPDELQKAAGFDFIDNNRIACVQDVAGSIFIYNFRSQKIEKEIPFAPPGDYESVCLVGSTAFVACADGRIYEVGKFLSAKPVIKEYGTHLTVRQNPSGICYDKPHRRLLVAIQGIEETSPNYKGVYAFDLKSRKMAVRPAVRINLVDTTLNPGNSKKLQQLLQPSDIAIHPGNERLYICDAMKSQLVVFNNRGVLKSIAGFPRKEIIQPEGIRITPSGELYIISAGARDQPGKIWLVEMPHD